MAEHSCSPPGRHHTPQWFAPHTESRQRGLGGDILYTGRDGRGMVVVMKTGEQEEGTVSFLQGIQWDRTNAGDSSLTTYPQRVHKDSYERSLT